MKAAEFNGYQFTDPITRKRMKYLIITKGDLDINNAYSFKSSKELSEYCSNQYNKERILAIFTIKDITRELLNKVCE